MAITVYKFPQPYLELELAAGGSLTSGATYYLMGWFQRYGGYYHPCHGPVSEEQSITPTAGNQSIKCSWWQNYDDITGFADAGGGQVTVSSASHGLSNGDSVKIIKTTNYNGTYSISNVASDTFEITATWNGDDATGIWLNDNSIPAEVTASNYGGICFKWDNYSMINSSTGKPYKWLNMNNPANSGKDEFDEADGHRRWGQAYHQFNSQSGGSVTFTTQASSTANTDLHDGAIQGSSYRGKGVNQIQVAHRNSIVGGGGYVDDSWDDLDAILYIKIDSSDSNNNWDDLVNALRNSGYTNCYRLMYTSTYCNGLIMAAGYDGDGSGTWTNAMLVSPGGWRCPNIVYDNCQIHTLSFNYQLRTSGNQSIRGTYKNTAFYYCGLSMDLYDSLVADNFSPYATSRPNFYQSCRGYTFSPGYGGYTAGGSRYYTLAYPNNGNREIRDVIANGVYGYIIESRNTLVASLNITNYTANNYGLQNYDFREHYGYYYNTHDVEITWNCTDVASDRPDGKVILYFTGLDKPNTYDITWNFRYGINVTVVDEEFNPIGGANVSLVGDETDTGVTDSSGESTVTMLGYTIVAPQGGSSGTYGTDSDWKSASLTISKPGYNTYKLNNIEIHEGQDWDIVLTKPIVNIDSEVIY